MFGDWEHAIMQHPVVSCGPNDVRPFLQNNEWKNVKGEMKRYLAWGHPELLQYAMDGPRNVFIDATFKVVPRGFSQLLIVMIYIPMFQVYIPLMYVLMTEKTDDDYFHALHMLIVATD